MRLHDPASPSDGSRDPGDLDLVSALATRAPFPSARPGRPAPPDVRLKSALLGTAIVAPLMLLYLMFGITDALPVLVATTGTLSFWVTRLTQFVVAGAFTVGMMTLLWPASDPIADSPGETR